MRPGYINQLLLAFRCYTKGHVAPLPALTLRHPYPVVSVHRVTGPYVPTVVFTLQEYYGVTLKIYLPWFNARCVDDADIDVRKLGRKK